MCRPSIRRLITNVNSGIEFEAQDDKENDWDGGGECLRGHSNLLNLKLYPLWTSSFFTAHQNKFYQFRYKFSLMAIKVWSLDNWFAMNEGSNQQKNRKI